MLLNCHSCYSFKYGILQPPELLKLAKQHGMEAVALTDINSTSATLDFIRVAQKYGIKPVAGIDFRNGVEQQYVALARSNDGYMRLNDFLSHHRHTEENFAPQAPELDDAFFIYPFEKWSGKALRDNEYIGVQPRQLNRLRFAQVRHLKGKLVMMNTATFRNRKDYNTHRLLRAIDNNTLLSKLAKAEEGDPDDIYLSREKIYQLYCDFPHLIENTERLLDTCQIHFDFGDTQEHQNRKYYTESLEGDWQRINRLCRDNLHYRYPNADYKILERVERELDVIRQKGFISYFLISHDLVNYARHKGYFYVGRGSGANSIVAYLLRITDVDPIELDLYFERFINLYRTNPPDFDIDFSWKDREDVTRYLFEQYGERHTALLGSYVTFQYRAVVRELGKVFGLPKHEIDFLSAGRYDYNRLDNVSRLVLQYGQQIHDLPNHLSVHAGGIVIAEKPIHYFTATDLPPKGFATTHFDMVTAEDVGLCKFDILGQRGLGKIKDAIEIVKENKPADPPIDVHDMKRFKEDEQIKELLRNGKAIGCFYVESPAMRSLLKKLRVEDYLSLVAASSIIRPGVSKSGMMREYIRRFKEPERRKDAHPVLLEIMPETYGVMVYQEDVIKVAHYFAGLSLAEADVLRRGMSGKFRSREEFQKAKEQFFQNCKEKGYADSMTEEVWRQIESFAGYAFAKGHSASFAVESYQSLFLKAHYPLEYMVATLNNGGGFYSPELYIHEARLHGGKVHAPCINRSGSLTVIYGENIYLGLGMVQELELQTIENILQARQEGPFEGLYDLTQRVSISLEQVSLLIRVGALRFTGKSRKELQWEAHFLFGDKKKTSPTRDLFRTVPKEFALPPLSTEAYEDAFNQLELLGFPLCDPYELLREQPAKYITAAQLPQYLGQEITTYGYLVNVKNTKTTNGKLMNFGTFLDHEGQFLDSVHFPPIPDKYPFRGRGIYKLTGRVMEEFGVYAIEISWMNKEPFIDDPRYSEHDHKWEKLTAEI